MDEEVEILLDLANKKTKDFDVIVDIFCMQMIWVSPRISKALEYKPSELVKLSIRDVLDVDPGKIMSHITKLIGLNANDTQVLKKRGGGKIRGYHDIKTVFYKKCPYLVISVVKMEDV